MKLELKNVKFYESMSEETNCFQADLFIDGKKIAYVKNTGQGGCTDYYAIELKTKNVLRQAEAYCLSLPMEKPDGYNFEYQPTLEHRIDDLFETWLKAKDEAKQTKRIKKDMLVAILCGTPDDYTMHFWWGKDKKKIPISQILSNEKTKNLVIDKIKTLKDQNILNTNLPAELF